MPWRIVVGLKDGVRDARGERVKEEIRQHLGIELKGVRTLDVYTVDARLSEEELEQAAAGPFSDPVIQEFAIDAPLAHDFDMLIEVGFRPGVTDNAGRTAKEAIQYLTGRTFAAGEGVYTSVQYLLSGGLSAAAAEKIARGFLANELIQRWTIVPAAGFDRAKGLPASVPKVTGGAEPQVRRIDLNVSDAELLQISRDGMLALNLEEMKVIQAHIADPAVQAQRAKVGLGAQLTDAELEALAQTWSEHCKHKIFSAKIEYDGRGGEAADHRLPLQDLHRRRHPRRARRQGGAGLLPLGLQGQRRGDPLQRRLERWSSRSKPTTRPPPSIPTAAR